MLTARILLAALLMIVLVGIAGFDLIVVAWGYPNSTVSAILQEWSRQHPIIPVVFGFVAGHLFWPVRF